MNTTELKENFSEKGKRGRPRNSALAALRSIYPDTSQRNADNKRAMGFALARLKAAGQEQYFFNKPANKFRQTILAALGRFPEEAIPELAREIAENQMPTSEALAFLRNARGKQFDVDALTRTLIRMVEQQGREATFDEVEHALCGALQHFRRMRANIAQNQPLPE